MAETIYYWDFDTDNVFLEEDENGNVIAEYTQEPNLYGELIAEERSGEVRYYNFDGQGSTRELTDENGEVTDTYTYTAFGEKVARTGTTENPFGYKGAMGYYSNTVTDDLYVRARTYEPTVGRWLSTDPLGYVDGLNLYGYVNSNPWNQFDPSGTFGCCCCKVHWVGWRSREIPLTWLTPGDANPRPGQIAAFRFGHHLQVKAKMTLYPEKASDQGPDCEFEWWEYSSIGVKNRTYEYPANEWTNVLPLVEGTKLEPKAWSDRRKCPVYPGEQITTDVILDDQPTMFVELRAGQRQKERVLYLSFRFRGRCFTDPGSGQKCFRQHLKTNKMGDIIEQKLDSVDCDSLPSGLSPFP